MKMYNCLASVSASGNDLNDYIIARSWYKSFGDINNTFISSKKYCDYKDLSILYHKSVYYNYNDFFITPKNDKSRILYYARNQKDDNFIKWYVKDKYDILRSFIYLPFFDNSIIMYNVITYHNYKYAIYYTCDESNFKKLKDKLKIKNISYCYFIMNRKLFYKFIKDYRIKDIKSIIREYEKIIKSGNDGCLKIWNTTEIKKA